MKLIIDITRKDYVEFNKFHFVKTRLKRTIITGCLTLVAFQLIVNQEKQYDWIWIVISSIVFALVYVFMINRSTE